MKISKLFEISPRTYSFEFFPPRDEISAVDFGINVGQLIKLSPSFVSVTYGAGGSNRERTFALVDYLQNKIGMTTMAHYTCVNAPIDKIYSDLNQLKNSGIENIMALRGDPRKGEDSFTPVEGGFSHANELIAWIRQNFDFCTGAAAYPDVHPEADSPESDIEALKYKIDAGAEFLITQLFFDNNVYFDFVGRVRKAGIKSRIIPGIIPITTYQQLARFTDMSRAKLPETILDSMESYKDNPAKITQIGMDYAIKQCRDLLMMGAPGLHFYTLNKSRATVEIFETLLR